MVLELVEEFLRRGCRVGMLANEIDGELRAAAIGNGIECFENADETCLFNYDIVYAQHHVLPLLISNGSLNTDDQHHFPVLVHNHLSPFEPYEVPGPFVEQALSDITFANSPETAEALGRCGDSHSNAEVFPNPAPREFNQVQSSPGNQLRRILVVSNHLPKELDQALTLVEKAGLSITRIGRKFRPERVTPDMLASHDAVVTIGKTVQYAIRASRPVYVYDKFGGPGWISDEISFRQAASHNFSGCDTPGQRDPMVLQAEITSGYSAARQYWSGLDDEWTKPYVLEHWVDSLIDRSSTLLKDEKRTKTRFETLRSQEFQQQLRQEGTLAALIRSEYLKRRKLEKSRKGRSAKRLFRKSKLWGLGHR